VPSLPRTLATATLGAALLLGASAARAEEDPDLVDPHAGTPRAAAPDLLAGSILIKGRFSPVFPSGSMTVGVAAPDISGVGIEAGGSLGVGLSRYVSLAAVGGYGTLPATSRCPNCDGSTMRFGLGMTYHLVQALAFQPTLRYAMAFRQTDIDTTDPLQGSLRDFVPGSYQGLDIAQVSLSGLFFPFQAVGIGPFVEMDLGTYVGRPDGARGNATYAFFQLGVELSFEPSSWLGSSPPVTRVQTGESLVPEGRIWSAQPGPSL
jgi:hypothetical protein